MTITSATRLLAVIGDPVAHSLSPLMHNAWLADHGIDAAYMALRLNGDNPAEAIRNLGAFNLLGANITVPHKEAAAAAATRTQASVANTLRWEPDGSLSAFNTDGDGFIDALDEASPHWREQTKRVLILGAGGAAAGIAAALAPHVETLAIANRTPTRADALAASFANAASHPWSKLDRAFTEADLIVQTTMIGMAGAPLHDWPMAACKQKAILLDIVYRPLETPFLAAARARGLTAIDGLGMLIHQGARAFELWFGVMPDTGKARERLIAALR